MVHPQIKKWDLHDDAPLSCRRTPQHSRRVSGDNSASGNILSHNATGTHGRAFANLHAAQDRCVRANRGPPPDNRWHAIPIGFRLRLPGGRRRPRKTIVDENDTVANKHFVLQRHAFTDESVTGNFATIANPGPFLNLHKSANLHIVANLAAVKICERENPDPLAKLYVWRNLLEELFSTLHADTISRTLAGTTTPWPLPLPLPWL
jgi:hypothetical protein